MKTYRIGTSVVGAVALLFAMWVSLGAAKTGFAGKWKGEIGFGPARGAVTQFTQRGFGGGRGGAAQKVTLNLKTKDNDTKASGNVTIGETTDDVKDGKIDGNKITFRAGTSPAPIYEYAGELNGDEIRMTRSAPAGARGGGSVQFTLKRD